MIKRVFRLTLRAVQGFIDSIFTLMGVPLRCPDYTCVSRRAKSVNVSFKTVTRGEIAHLVIDSTGLKVFGEGDTLYAWSTQAGVGVAESQSPGEWSQDARFAVPVETAPLSAHAVAEYCRRKGLYPEQIQQWRDEFMQPDQREERALIKKQQKEIQQLNREIARKDKALAEAAALLILEKNWRRSSPKNARTNDTHGRQVTTDGCGAGSP